VGYNVRRERSIDGSDKYNPPHARTTHWPGFLLVRSNDSVILMRCGKRHCRRRANWIAQPPRGRDRSAEARAILVVRSRWISATNDYCGVPFGSTGTFRRLSRLADGVPRCRFSPVMCVGYASFRDHRFFANHAAPSSLIHIATPRDLHSRPTPNASATRLM
jgi:hypothetical protein